MKGFLNNTKQLSKLGFFTSLLSLSFSVNAAFPVFSQQGQFEWSANVGLSWLQTGNSNVVISEFETDRLRQTRTPLAGDLGLGIAYLIPLNKSARTDLTWFPELRTALNIRYMDQEIIGQNVYGEADLFQDPNMNNYTYDLSLASTRLMIDLVLTVASMERFSVFLLGGVGAGWTQVDYKDRPNPGIVGGALSLNSRTNNRLVGEAGAGLAYDCNNQFRFSLAYLYTDYGTIKTGSQGVIDFNNPITINPMRFSFHTQAILFGVHIKV
ncbi:TPA: outer membrane beta-barrel protein [Legionella feeleii]|uniref:Opacity protein and related surface antigens n=1 Tax=Legionella feeleii TaxID=453 RepID=A0A378ITQ6_9GAMM|nr:outer membrane beta-barrel protein [Legionella feeleii]STX38587.1 Opacity protein and related surface antigens [Legionella feeleii]